MSWWRLLGLGLLGCGASRDPASPEPRERDVLVEAPADIVVLYRDGDTAWQLAPQVGSRYGFDLTSEHYAVAFLDPARGRVDSLYTTLAERTDITWHVPASERTHQISGTLSGLGELGGLVAGKNDSQAIDDGEASKPYLLDVAEGSQVLAFGRKDSGVGGPRIQSLAIRRDVVVASDLELDLDIAAEALPTTVSQVEGPAGCSHTSTFAFGETKLQLGRQLSARTLVAPHPDQWRAGDHLSFTSLCNQGDVLLESTYDIPSAELSPVVERPPVLEGASFSDLGDRWQFAWAPYESPVDYEMIVSGQPCDRASFAFAEFEFLCSQRWTSKISEGWTTAAGTTLDVLSNSDLEAFGHPELALQRPLAWLAGATRETSSQRMRAFVVKDGLQ